MPGTNDAHMAPRLVRFLHDTDHIFNAFWPQNRLWRAFHHSRPVTPLCLSGTHAVWPFCVCSNKASPVASIGRHFINDCAITHKEEVGEAFAEFARFCVTHEDGVAQMQF